MRVLLTFWRCCFVLVLHFRSCLAWRCFPFLGGVAASSFLRGGVLSFLFLVGGAAFPSSFLVVLPPSTFLAVVLPFSVVPFGIELKSVCVKSNWIFLVVVLSSVVFHSSVVLFLPSLFWVLFPSSLSLCFKKKSWFFFDFCVFLQFVFLLSFLLIFGCVVDFWEAHWKEQRFQSKFPLARRIRQINPPTDPPHHTTTPHIAAPQGAYPGRV